MRRQIFLAVVLGALIVPLAAVGGQWLRDARDVSTTPTSEQAGGALAASSPTPSPTPQPLIASVTRDEAIALVRAIADNVRIDRLEAKLVPWSELEPIGMGVDMTGGPLHGGGPADVVWAVAVAGDILPRRWGRHDEPRRHFSWALWGVDAVPFARLVSLNVGEAERWPPGFDALADHVAMMPTPAPAAPTPPVFEHVAHAPSHPPRLRDMAMAADGTLFGSTEGLTLMRSDDGGSTWRTLDVPIRGSGLRHVAAVDSLVFASDIGADHDDACRSTTGGLYLSSDRGETWRRVVDDAIAEILVHRRSDGSTLFLAERPCRKGGAATGPSAILASLDGTRWREIGEVPGPAVFGALDVPIVSFIKNDPRDGILRVEGNALDSLRLVPVAASGQAWTLVTAPDGRLWSYSGNSLPHARYSDDSGRTWVTADGGLDGRIAGLFFSKGHTWAVGDGSYLWDGARWQNAGIVTGKASAVFQLGTAVFIQDIPGSLWRLR